MFLALVNPACTCSPTKPDIFLPRVSSATLGNVGVEILNVGVAAVCTGSIVDSNKLFQD